MIFISFTLHVSHLTLHITHYTLNVFSLFDRQSSIVNRQSPASLLGYRLVHLHAEVSAPLAHVAENFVAYFQLRDRKRFPFFIHEPDRLGVLQYEGDLFFPAHRAHQHHRPPLDLYPSYY